MYYVHKTLTAVGSAQTITPYSDISINHPVFVLDSVSYAPRVNYCKVTYDNDDEKYYYCTVSLNNGGQNIVSCDIDPLMTNETALRACNATILRYSYKGSRTGSTMFPDSKIPILPNKKEIKSTILSNQFFSTNAPYSYLLAVIGGENNGD
jgi:hypothetical protein